MRKLLWIFAIVLGCSQDDDSSSPTRQSTPPPVSGGLDGGSAQNTLDASAPPRALVDAAPACTPIAICADNMVGTLYNVCSTGASTEASLSTGCLVDSNGKLYVLALPSDARITNPGWTQSAGPAGSTLSADDAARCAQAIAALSADASAPSPCAKQ